MPTILPWGVWNKLAAVITSKPVSSWLSMPTLMVALVDDFHVRSSQATIYSPVHNLPMGCDDMLEDIWSVRLTALLVAVEATLLTERTLSTSEADMVESLLITS